MPVDPKWIENAVQAVRALDAVYGPHVSVAQGGGSIWCDTVFVKWPDGGNPHRSGRTAPWLRFDIGGEVNTKEHADALLEALEAPKPADDRRCGTCVLRNGVDSVEAEKITGMALGTPGCPYYALSIRHGDGPPWECRFWRRR